MYHFTYVTQYQHPLVFVEKKKQLSLIKYYNRAGFSQCCQKASIVPWHTFLFNYCQVWDCIQLFSRKVVQQNGTQQCQKVLWVMGIRSPLWRL